MTAVSATMAMPVLIRTVKAHIEKGNRAAEKSDQHYVAAGLLLKEAKERKPADITWPDFVRQHFDLGRSRADELIQIADGRTTVAAVREGRAESVRRVRENPPLRSGGSSTQQQLAEEDYAIESDSDWERGMLARAKEAVSGAAFEDWSHIEVGDLVVNAVRKAANAWTDLTAYLESLQPEPEPEPARVDTETLNFLKSELKRAEDRDAQRQIEHQLIDIGYRALATKLHPDTGGSTEAMVRLNQVRDDLKSRVIVP